MFPISPASNIKHPQQGPLVPPELQGPVGFQNTPRIFKADHDRISRATAQFDVVIMGSMLVLTT